MRGKAPGAGATLPAACAAGLAEPASGPVLRGGSVMAPGKSSSLQAGLRRTSVNSLWPCASVHMKICAWARFAIPINAAAKTILLCFVNLYSCQLFLPGSSFLGRLYNIALALIEKKRGEDQSPHPRFLMQYRQLAGKPPLQRVVHIELGRMRGHAHALHVLHFQFQVSIDHGIAEYAATGQELAVLVQRVECFFQRSANGRDQCIFLWRQMVQIFRGGFAWMDLVGNAVQTGHQQCCEAQVWVGQWIRETCFHAAAFWIGNVWNTDRGGTVFRRVSQFHWCFVAWYQALVRVGAWVGDGVQCLGVLDNAADVVQGEIGQAGIAVASEQVFAIFPYGLMHVHARTVVANDRFWHEGSSLAIAVRHVPDHVFQVLRPVGALDQGRELGADFILASASNFMVVHFDWNAQRFQDQTHFRTHVLEAVYWWHWEIAAFDRRTVAAVAAFDVLAGRPGTFVRTDLDETARHVDFPANAVEDEEFWLRAEVGGIAHARRF